MCIYIYMYYMYNYISISESESVSVSISIYIYILYIYIYIYVYLFTSVSIQLFIYVIKLFMIGHASFKKRLHASASLHRACGVQPCDAHLSSTALLAALKASQVLTTTISRA